MGRELASRIRDERKRRYSFLPKLHHLASAPTANPAFDFGGGIPLVTLTAPFGGSEDGLGEKQKELPIELRVRRHHNGFGDLRKDDCPVVFGFKGDVDDGRNPSPQDFGNWREM